MSVEMASRADNTTNTAVHADDLTAASKTFSLVFSGIHYLG